MLSKTEFEAYSAIVDSLRVEYRKFYFKVYENEAQLSDMEYRDEAVIVCNTYKSKLEELIVKYVESAVKVQFNQTHAILTEKTYISNHELTRYINKLKTTLYAPFKGATLSVRLTYICNELLKETLKYKSNRGNIRYKSMFKEFRFLSMIANLSARLLFSEVKRLERETTLSMCRDSNVKFLRWVSPPKRKGRKEDICDEYSKYSDPFINMDNKQGIFRIEEYPEYPHPNCNCKIEII